MSGCRVAGADGEGAPSTKAWRGSGGLPTWAGPRPGWTLPSRAVSELPAARGGGFLRSRHSGLGAGPTALQGRRVSEVRTRLTQPGLQADWARLGVQIRARKSLQRDGRASCDAHRESETEREGLAHWWSFQALGVWSPQAGRAETRSPRPDPCCPAVAPDLVAGTAHTRKCLPPPPQLERVSVLPLPPTPDCKKISFKFSTPCLKCAWRNLTARMNNSISFN